MADDFTTNWTRFDEFFDSSDGGCLYIRISPDDSDTVQATGAEWLDGGQDGLHYWAGVFEFTLGVERYGDIDVNEPYQAAEAFSDGLDSEIAEEIGWFSMMDEAVKAVEDAVHGYLA